MDTLDTSKNKIERLLDEAAPRNDLVNATENSIVSGTGGVSYEALMSQYVPHANKLADPNTVNDIEEGKWGKLYDRATLQANTSIKGGVLALYEMGMKDPNYIPLRDPQFTSLPIADQLEIANQVKDAADPNMMKGYIRSAYEAKEIRAKAEAAAGGVLNFGADLVGSLFDPVNLIAFRGSYTAATALTRIATLSAEAGTAITLQELGRQKTDPTVQNSEVAMNAVAGVMLGAFLGGLGEAGRGLSGKGVTAIRDALSGGGEEISLANIPNRYDSAGAARFIDPKDYHLAETNRVFDLASKVFNFGQELDGLKSPSTAMNKYTSEFSSHNYLLQGNLKGQATPQSVLNMADAQFYYRQTPLKNGLEESYTNYKQEGGTLNQAGFMAEVRKVSLGVQDTNSKAISEGASHVRKYLDNIAEDLQRVDPEFKKRADYYPQVFDRRKIEDNPLGFKEDLKTELLEILRKEQLEYLRKNKPEIKPEDIIPANADDLKFKEYLTAMYERLLYDSAGMYHKQPRVRAWSNHHLEQRSVNLSKEFMDKYGPNDIMHTLEMYGKKSSQSYGLLNVTGLRDPYKALDNLTEDYLQMEQRIRNNPELSPEKANNLLKELQKNLGKDKDTLTKLIDQFTKNHMADVSLNARNAAALAKAHVYLTTMGGVIWNMITDLVRIAKKAFEGMGMTSSILSLTRGVADSFRFIADKETARTFGIISDPIGGVSRSTMWADMGGLDVLTKTERGARTATSVFSKLTLMDFFNDASRTYVGETVSKILLGHAKDLVEGKIDPNSVIGIELNKMGFTPKLAQEVLDNFELHKEIKQGQAFSGINDWDASTGIEFRALVQRAVNNEIIVPTNGSRPAISMTLLGGIATQLKGFLFASTNKFFLPALQNMAGVHPAIAAKTLSTIAGDLALASVVGVAQAFGKGQEPDLSEEAILNSVLTKNATFAILGLGNDAAGVFGYSSRDWLGLNNHIKGNPSDSAFRQVSSAVGLAAGPFTQSLLTAGYYGSKYASATTTKAKDANARRLIRLIPGNNLLYWNWALQAPQKKH